MPSCSNVPDPCARISADYSSTLFRQQITTKPYHSSPTHRKQEYSPYHALVGAGASTPQMPPESPPATSEPVPTTARVCGITTISRSAPASFARVGIRRLITSPTSSLSITSTSNIIRVKV
ncbi:hypothetical protein CI102_12901 [Trichoderma harzianum]|nr:hypothetical protein CI102_12901 [Trichoderma harzianum]